MNCSEFRKLLYAYPELGDAERAMVEAHVQDCPACASQLSDFMSMRRAAERISFVTPQPENFSALTSRIMQAVEADRKKKVSIVGRIVSPIGFRLAMTMASLALIILFILEQTNVPVSSGVPMATQSRGVILDTRKMYVAVQQRITSPKPASKNSLISCLRDETCMAAIKQNFKRNRL